MLIVTVGFHDTLLLPTTDPAEKAVRDAANVTLLATSSSPGVKVPTPLDAVDAPDQ
jgi:hypothetical protein